MPRTRKFNSARAECSRNNAIQTTRCMRGKFAKCEPKGGASPIPNTGMEGKFMEWEASPSKLGEKLLPLRLHSLQPTLVEADRHPSNMNDATLMERHQIDDSRCYFCRSEDRCELHFETHYTLCFRCRISSPTQEWWHDDVDSNSNTAHGSTHEDDNVFTECEVASYLPDENEVYETLMNNGSRLRPAKRGIQKVSVNNRTQLYKDEPKCVHKLNERKRQEKLRARRIQTSLQAAAVGTAHVQSFFQKQHQEAQTQQADDCFDLIMDEAFADCATVLHGRVNNMDPKLCVQAKSVKDRLWEFRRNQEKTLNIKGALLATAYLKFDEYLRLGNDDGKGGFSELRAGRLVATSFFPRPQQARKNVSRNTHNKKQWYRYRARAIINGFRYFVATGCLLPESRGKCKGMSLVHDPIVRHYCFEIIGQLGTTWSARTFRDKISAKLFASGYLKEGKKIGRCTATYYLREIGMVLVHPKKGIYKDGHERVDTVEYRKKYTNVLNAFKRRECTYKGELLETEVSPNETLQREAIRVYHDECIYASHEGAIQLWVHNGTDGKYKKPRGEIVMASGFICRYKAALYS